MAKKISLNAPLVSVCLPSLNTFPFLEERVDTILAQTYTNWEMIVIDGLSDDGSWGLFEKLARKDQRVSIAQAPRGLYASWNKCIEAARGEYVYIATSDDTMAADCLEKLVAALEEHKDCDLAQCSLVAIDEAGAPMADRVWKGATVFGHGLERLLTKQHLRRAPYDGLLHLTGAMVHLSVTQLLIRRSLFARIGGFETRWGSIGDRNWEMRAGLVTNTIFIPDTWATWRVHSASATASLSFHSVEYTRRIEEMLSDAIERCEASLAPVIVSGLHNHWLDYCREMRTYYTGLRTRENLSKRLFQVSHALSCRATRAELMNRLSGKPKWGDRVAGEIQRWLESLGVGPMVTDLTYCSDSSRTLAQV
jgi:glycosyltransferase involved in cell wall biosynthesis